MFWFKSNFYLVYIHSLPLKAILILILILKRSYFSYLTRLIYQKKPFKKYTVKLVIYPKKTFKKVARENPGKYFYLIEAL